MADTVLATTNRTTPTVVVALLKYNIHVAMLSLARRRDTTAIRSFLQCEVVQGEIDGLSRFCLDNPRCFGRATGGVLCRDAGNVTTGFGYSHVLATVAIPTGG